MTKGNSLLSRIGQLPLLGTVARRLYLALLGSGGAIDYVRYYYYLLQGGWTKAQIGNQTFEFRCSGIAETRRSTVAFRNERPVIEALIRECDRGDIVFDVGANVGTHGIVMAEAVGPKGCVVCFEPHEKTYQGLLANVARNGFENVRTEKFALGAYEGSTELYIQNDDAGVGTHSTQRLEDDEVQTQSIEVIPGDRFIEESKLIPDLVKIDVEGSEGDVLAGLNNTLSSDSPTLFVELHNGVEAASIEQRLVSQGYSCRRLQIEKDILVAEAGGNET